MQRSIWRAGLALAMCSAGFAQTSNTSLTFEVASIKPAAPQPAGMMMMGMRGGPGSPDPGQVTFTNMNLTALIMQAYAVKRYQITGPDWLDGQRYDIVAKVPSGATRDDLKVMLQNLLVERFKLALHKDQKELPMYALVVGKNGPKLKEAAENSESSTAAGGPSAATGGPSAIGGGIAPAGGASGGVFRRAEGGGAIARPPVGKDGFPEMPKGTPVTRMMVVNGRFRVQANQATTQSLADILGNHLNRPVVDQTGLTGKYDITLDFTPDESQGMFAGLGRMAPPPGDGPPAGSAAGSAMPGTSASDPQGGPSLFTALQEQLGLRLEPRKGPVEHLIIDHVEKTPTEN